VNKVEGRKEGRKKSRKEGTFACFSNYLVVWLDDLGKW
jgi:hypothetical protein